MTTKLEIFNFALSQVGLGITNDTESAAPHVRAARNVYDMLRKNLLEDHYWNFAVKRTTLALRVDAPNNGEWLYQHSLPSDFISLKDVKGIDKYEIDEGTIKSDEQTLKIEYVADITDATDFSPGFATTLSYDLALVLAGRFPIISGTKMQLISAERDKVYKRAKVNDGKQSAPVSSKSDEAFYDWHNNPYGVE